MSASASVKRARKSVAGSSTSAASVPGGGPRHLRFSVDGKLIYLLNELSLSVTVFAWNAEAGTAEQLGTVRFATRCNARVAPQFVKARMSDYDHLARVFEWSTSGEEGEE